MKVIRFKMCWPVWLLLLSAGVTAQDLNPIRWAIKSESAAVKAGEIFKVQVVATIDEGWHLYSLEQPAGGPIPTRIFVAENQKFSLDGDLETVPAQVLFDPNFNMDTQFYEKEAVFGLPVKAAPDAPTGTHTLVVNAFYQTCNDKTCLPPKLVKLTAEIKVSGGQPAAEPVVKATSPEAANPSRSENADAKVVDFEFVDFNGKRRQFSEFKGKIVLLDFWATWCSPCLKDIPKLKVLYDKYKAQGFEIIGMDSETIGDEETADPEFAKETAERARQIVKTRGVNWTQATTESAVPLAKNMFGVTALPTKILIDKNGNIVARIGEKDDLTAIVEKLLTAQ